VLADREVEKRLQAETLRPWLPQMHRKTGRHSGKMSPSDCKHAIVNRLYDGVTLVPELLFSTRYVRALLTGPGNNMTENADNS